MVMMLMTTMMPATWTNCVCGLLLLLSILPTRLVPAERLETNLLESLMARKAIFGTHRNSPDVNKSYYLPAAIRVTLRTVGRASSDPFVEAVRVLSTLGHQQTGSGSPEKLGVVQDTLASSLSPESPQRMLFLRPTPAWWPARYRLHTSTAVDSPEERRGNKSRLSDSTEGGNTTRTEHGIIHAQPWTSAGVNERGRGESPWTLPSPLNSAVRDDPAYSVRSNSAVTLGGQDDENVMSAEERRSLDAERPYLTLEPRSTSAPRQLRRVSQTDPNPRLQKVPHNTRRQSLTITQDQTQTHTGARYDDHPTIVPRQADVSLPPIPRTLPPSARALPWGSLLRRANTLAPTPGPHTLAPSPIRAPATKLPTPTSPATTTTTTTPSRPSPTPPYPQPTPRVTGGLVESVGGGGGDVSKRTQLPNPTVGSGGHSDTAVCLEFVSVEHDVDCQPHRTRRSPTSPRHLTLLLEHLGGSPSSPFTAPTLRLARSRFRNLMPVGIPEVDEHIHLSFTASHLEELLEKHYADNDQSQSMEPVPRSENGDGVSRQDADDFLQLPADFVQQMVPARHVTVNSTLLRTRRSFDPGNQQSYACPNSVDCDHFDGSQCPGGQTETVVDENNCDTCLCAVGSTTGGGGYCQHSGSQGSGGVQSPRSRLCTQCQRTRHLGSGVFPSYLQEVVCYPPSAPCLDVGGALGPQGQCQESRVPVSVLRRNPGRCMRIELTTGQSLVLDDWRLSQQMVRTGCQCMVDKRSPMAHILPRS